jgi:hypothetical protein
MSNGFYKLNPHLECIKSDKIGSIIRLLESDASF